MTDKLRLLASKIGIATEYNDAGLNAKTYYVEDDTIRFFANVLGYKADTEADIEKSLKKVESKFWQSVLESVYVREQKSLNFTAVIETSLVESDFAIKLYNQQSSSFENVSFVVNVTEETHGKYTKLLIEITTPLAIGYYDLYFSVGEKEYKSVLAVAPEHCYQPEVLDGSKLWGYALQLYSLRSKRNWGIGDFTDLESFIKLCGQNGADVIGLNPINVPNHCFPEEASPYLSTSRLFLNPIYIDVEKVPEFKPEDIENYREKIAQLNTSETILYGEVYPLKMAFMEKFYPRMQKNEKRKKEFEDFCKEKGQELENLAAFQCLYEQKWQDHWGGWKSWEKEFLKPTTVAMKKYKTANKERIGFFKYLQFEAYRQFNLVAQSIKEQGLKIGIYRDLAVGVGRDSAEVWGDEGAYLKSSGAGAPPDAFFPAGQKWNLGAFHPVELKERAYLPFIKMLRAAAENAGALRIDHVMCLMRLFVIPEAANKQGTYIYYNFDDMLNIVAIESHLNKCMIVGESIGNVPDGFLEKIESKNIYSMSILWSERWDAGWGDFKQPHFYPEKTFTSIGTHDMAPLKMWWFGYDISTSRELGIMTSDEEMYNAYHKREADRWKLLKAMDEQSVWPEDNYRHGDYMYGEGYPEGLEEAAHRYMARTNAKVFLVQPEDVFQVDKLQNLPGTDRDKHPNWRRKLPINIEDIEDNIAYKRNLSAVKKER
ncbi:MAG: 4-alpha-glucanotransferase [Alphaproteobacteria bacterium]|nr:4-alpha-glucanotransferase [Alphaproteobacteria bacterium]